MPRNHLLVLHVQVSRSLFGRLLVAHKAEALDDPEKAFGFPMVNCIIPEGPLVLHEDGFWGVNRSLSTSSEATWTLWAWRQELNVLFPGPMGK